MDYKEGPNNHVIERNDISLLALDLEELAALFPDSPLDTLHKCVSGNPTDFYALLRGAGGLFDPRHLEAVDLREEGPAQENEEIDHWIEMIHRSTGITETSWTGAYIDHWRSSYGFARVSSEGLSGEVTTYIFSTPGWSREYFVFSYTSGRNGHVGLQDDFPDGDYYRNPKSTEMDIVVPGKTIGMVRE